MLNVVYDPILPQIHQKNPYFFRNSFIDDTFFTLFVAYFSAHPTTLLLKILGGRMHEPVWYENLSGVVSCPENSNKNTDGLDSVVIGSRDQ